MGGDNTDTSTTTTGSSSPSVQRALNTLGGKFNTQLKQGWTPYTDSLVPDMSAYTTKGMDMLGSAARNTGGLDTANSWAQGLVNNGGYNTALTSAQNRMSSIGNQFGGMADRLNQPSAAQNTYGAMADDLSGRSYADKNFQKLFQGAGGPSLTEQTLMDVAQGKAFGMDDPGFASLRGNLINDVTSNTNSAFNASGRFGGGSNVESLSSGLGRAVGELDYSNYQNDIARQERALGAIEGTRQQGFANQMGALSAQDAARMGQINTRAGLVGAQDQARLAQLGARTGALQNEMGAAQGIAGIGQTAMGNAAGAAGMLPGLYQAGLIPGQTMMGIGQVRDAYNTAKAEDKARMFDARNNKSYNSLAKIVPLLTGAAPAVGSTTTQSQPGVPLWQQLMGYVAGNAGKAIGTMGG